MIVAAHQPHFLPWLGYFDKMRKADLFILVDHVQFERQNYQNRTLIKTGEDSRWITVPVRQCSRDERILDKLIDNTGSGRHRWGRRMALTLKYAYQGAEHFDDCCPAVLELLDAPWERLVDLNLRLLELCRTALDIRTPVVRSSELALSGQKSEMVLNMCKEVGADAYLSGTGASRNYLDLPAFERAGVRVIWQDFTHPRYAQHPCADTFISKLSVFDLLANCGTRGAMALAGRPIEEAVTV